MTDDFCFNNTELMRWRKSVCDLAGGGETAGEPSRENRPTVFISALWEDRAGSLGIQA